MNDHPAGVRGPLWWGRECEGKHSGKFTAFVERALSAEDTCAVVERAQHVFLTEDFGRTSDDYVWLAGLLSATSASVVIAREPDQVRAYQAAIGKHGSRVELMLRIFLPADFMEAVSEVAIGVRFHQYVAELSAFRVALPSDYAGDVP